MSWDCSSFWGVCTHSGSLLLPSYWHKPKTMSHSLGHKFKSFSEQGQCLASLAYHSGLLYLQQNLDKASRKSGLQIEGYQFSNLPSIKFYFIFERKWIIWLCLGSRECDVTVNMVWHLPSLKKLLAPKVERVRSLEHDSFMGNGPFLPLCLCLCIKSLQPNQASLP